MLVYSLAYHLTTSAEELFEMSRTSGIRFPVVLRAAVLHSLLDTAPVR